MPEVSTRLGSCRVISFYLVLRHSTPLSYSKDAPMLSSYEACVAFGDEK